MGLNFARNISSLLSVLLFLINLIKDNTNTEITVGQNGRVWIKGDLEGENKATKAIELIERESSSEGLTDTVEEFLKKSN